MSKIMLDIWLDNLNWIFVAFEWSLTKEHVIIELKLFKASSPIGYDFEGEFFFQLVGLP